MIGIFFVGVLAFLAPKAGWHAAGWILKHIDARDRRLAWERRCKAELDLEDIRTAYEDR